VPSEDGYNIFECTTESGNSIKEIISLCTGLEVCDDDSFPETICPTCLQDAKNAFEIKGVYEKSQVFYCQLQREYLEKSNAILKLSLNGKENNYQRMRKSMETDSEKAQSKDDLLETDKNQENDNMPKPHNDCLANIIEDKTKRLRVIKPYTCPHCWKICKGKTHYTEHLRVHTGDEFEKNNAASKLVRPSFYQSIIPAG